MPDAASVELRWLDKISNGRAGFCRGEERGETAVVMRGLLMSPSRRIDQHPTDGFREQISFVLWRSFAYIG